MVFNKTKSFQCKHCEKCFTSRYNLTKHMRAHNGDKPFKCAECGKCFAFSSNLSNHRFTHTGQKRHKCEHCEESFALKLTLEQHVRKHTGEKPYQCKCGQSFAWFNALKKHSCAHKIVPVIRCEHCNQNFRSNYTLKRHVVRMHTSNRFTCDICKRSFTGKLSLIKHLLVHGSKERFECNICEKSYGTKKNFAKHIKQHATEKKLMKCNECGKVFNNIYNLKRHAILHELKFECDYCMKVFEQKMSLVSHIRTCYRKTSNSNITKNVLKNGEASKNNSEGTENLISLKSSSQSMNELNSCKIIREEEEDDGVNREALVLDNQKFENEQLCTPELHTNSDENEKNDEIVEENANLNALLPELQFECDYCGKVFKQRLSLVCHIRTCSRETNSNIAKNVLQNKKATKTTSEDTENLVSLKSLSQSMNELNSCKIIREEEEDDGVNRDAQVLDNQKFENEQFCTPELPTNCYENEKIDEIIEENVDQSINLSPTMLFKNINSRTSSSAKGRRTIEEFMYFINLDPQLRFYANLFQYHEIDETALNLLNTEYMIKFMGLKLGPALKIFNFINLH